LRGIIFLINSEQPMRDITGLLHAASFGDLEECKKIISDGVSANGQGGDGKPLCLAAANGRLEVCRLLVEAGANLSADDPQGLTALMHASRQGHIEVCSLLVAAGAQIHQATSHGATALTMAGSLCEGSEANVLQALLRPAIESKRTPSKAMIEALSDSLLRPAMRGDLAACQLLIHAGANVDFDDERGWTPLLLAEANDKLAVCRLLLEHGANPLLAGLCSRPLPLTPFQVAVESGSGKVVAYFLDTLDEDPDQCTSDGRRLSELASKNCSINNLLESTRAVRVVSAALGDSVRTPGNVGRTCDLAL
jgi:hypothetical protein